MEKITETVKIQIDELLAEKDMILVAIDGKCTSGKTTLLPNWQSSMTAMYFTWMTFSFAQSREHLSGLPK